MDVKNTWVSEIRKVLTGQLEACKGVFFTSGVRDHSPSRCNTTQSQPCLIHLTAYMVEGVITEVDVVGCGAEFHHFSILFTFLLGVNLRNNH